eukprot:1492903-Alexandrium_andersonii.AAC.1
MLLLAKPCKQCLHCRLTAQHAIVMVAAMCDDRAKYHTVQLVLSASCLLQQPVPPSDSNLCERPRIIHT